MYHFGYIDRFDQVRGISPLAPALNSLADVYKGVEYALAKMKVAQLFGLTIYRDKYDKMGNLLEGVDADGNQEYQINFGKGPQFLDLNAGDKAEFLETNSPSPAFQQFITTVIAIALKALDIPFSFYDESFTTYSGSRQALLQYEAAAKVRRDDVEELLDHLTAWRLGMAIYDGELDANFEDIRWEWIHKGIGWVDPLSEIQANIQAVTNGLDSRTRIVKETTGRDFADLVEEIAAEQKLMIDKQVVLAPAAPVPVTRVEAPHNVAA
jgi:capsid protein